MPRTIKSNTNDRTSIFTNTFFKICGFAKFDRFDDFMKRLLDISKEFHFVFLFIMIKTSIFTNTFFKICGFGRVDRFDDFLKCMLDISKWYGMLMQWMDYTHVSSLNRLYVTVLTCKSHPSIIRHQMDRCVALLNSTWSYRHVCCMGWIYRRMDSVDSIYLGAGEHCITDPHSLHCVLPRLVQDRARTESHATASSMSGSMGRGPHAISVLRPAHSRTHHALHTSGRIMQSILQDACVAKARPLKFHPLTIMSASSALALHRGQIPSNVSELRTFFSGSYHKDELNDKFFVYSRSPCGNEQSHSTG